MRFIPSNNRCLILELIYGLIFIGLCFVKAFTTAKYCDISLALTGSIGTLIEVLRRIRTTWERKLADQSLHGKVAIKSENIDIVYKNLIQSIDKLLMLKSWNSLTTYFINYSVPTVYIEGSNEFAIKIFNTIWPQDKPVLEMAIKNLETRNSAFIKHYMKRAIWNGSDWWKEDRSWKKIRHTQEKYSQLAKEEEDWRDEYGNLLLNICLALNEFSSAVRNYIDNEYRLLEGEFSVIDSLGSTNDMAPILYKPTEYRV